MRSSFPLRAAASDPGRWRLTGWSVRAAFLMPLALLLAVSDRLDLGPFGDAAAAAPETDSKSGAASPESRKVSFNREIRPLLSDRCFACHGPDSGTREAGLRLDRRDEALGSGVLEPGAPEFSELVSRVEADDEGLVMPPPGHGERLTPDEQTLIRRWIEQGAEYEAHWSFVPPVRVEPPVTTKRSGGNVIDRFIDRGIEEAGVTPAPRADPRTLVRRLAFDLTGLPPDPEIVEAFVADPSDVAYERLVERFLQSPHHGERLAMYWLDLVRYADTLGFHGDQVRSVSPYRDYVIRAFRENKPFDEFTIEQLAGDLLPDATLETKVASTYNRLNRASGEGGVQPKEYLARYAADRVRTTGAVWLGTTFGCAECHDHKFDPYTIKEFYEFAAFFADIKEQGIVKSAVYIEQLPVPTDDQRSRQAELKRAIGDAEREQDADSPRLERLREELKSLEQSIVTTLATTATEPREMRVLPRGNWMDDSGEIVTPNVPAFLPPIEPSAKSLTATSAEAAGEEENGAAVDDPDGAGPRRYDRLDLARWLTRPDHPLVARSFANRLWMLFFGEGLSRSVDDLGSQGEPPTHPGLLDRLACEFVDSGWDVRHLIRLIVRSDAYRRSSDGGPELVAADPANETFARQGRWRLDAEMVRDNALAAGGLLMRELGGPSVKPYQPDGYWSQLNFPKRSYSHDTGPAQYRRGIYTHWQRTFLHPSLLAFDAPAREECAARRTRSNTPLQALVLLNDPSQVEAARVLAQRAVEAGGDSFDERLAFVVREVLARAARPAEATVLRRLAERSREAYEADPNAAERLTSTGLAPPPAPSDIAEVAVWTAVTRAVLNLHETIMRY